jgi:hypothetical protein
MSTHPLLANIALDSTRHNPLQKADCPQSESEVQWKGDRKVFVSECPLRFLAFLLDVARPRMSVDSTRRRTNCSLPKLAHVGLTALEVLCSGCCLVVISALSRKSPLRILWPWVCQRIQSLSQAGDGFGRNGDTCSGSSAVVATLPTEHFLPSSTRRNHLTHRCTRLAVRTGMYLNDIAAHSTCIAFSTCPFSPLLRRRPDLANLVTHRSLLICYFTAIPILQHDAVLTATETRGSGRVLLTVQNRDKPMSSMVEGRSTLANLIFRLRRT